jgi:small subunit ribosomal protein S17
MEDKIVQKGKKRQLEGVVVSNKMDRTVRVRVDHTMRHPLYQKIQSRSKIYFAHTDEKLEIGAKVVIRESKPYSKNVKWVVIK